MNKRAKTVINEIIKQDKKITIKLVADTDDLVICYWLTDFTKRQRLRRNV